MCVRRKGDLAGLYAGARERLAAKVPKRGRLSRELRGLMR